MMMMTSTTTESVAEVDDGYNAGVAAATDAAAGDKQRRLVRHSNDWNLYDDDLGIWSGDSFNLESKPSADIVEDYISCSVAFSFVKRIFT
ncbi:Hypothetical predicted protein [Octopus vulgaris]|uniref:Uncharacterized protein n=1 Tax=Octopus vulgaris TaxID=6645 RepID=A0AA36F4Z6_OCTVU|nr:Hypothetical predicted protein [Octopus vulgaris]